MEENLDSNITGNKKLSNFKNNERNVNSSTNVEKVCSLKRNSISEEKNND